VGNDLVAAGFAGSRARPGGNVTGSTFFIPELMAKRLEVLKDILPSMTRSGVLLVRNNRSTRGILEAMASAAQALNVAVQPIEVGEPGEFDNALSAWVAPQAGGFVMQDHGFLLANSAHEDSNPANPAFAGKLQQAAILANENCDRATALAHTLSAQLREAQNRINRLEFEADGLVDRLRAEAKTAVAKLQSEADARVDRTNRQADERIARQEAEAKNLVSRLQGELTQAKQRAERVKAESDARIERIKIEADEGVARAQAEADERLGRARAEIEGQFSRLEADVAQARQRADRAEQWLVRIRREIEGHLMPSFGAVHGRGANERRE
jgi:hypothetical protein